LGLRKGLGEYFLVVQAVQQGARRKEVRRLKKGGWKRRKGVEREGVGGKRKLVAEKGVRGEWRRGSSSVAVLLFAKSRKDIPWVQPTGATLSQYS